jgi:hypothetical protein
MIMEKYFFSYSWSNDDGKSISSGFGNAGMDFPKGTRMNSMEDVKRVEDKISNINKKKGITNVILISWRKFTE